MERERGERGKNENFGFRINFSFLFLYVVLFSCCVDNKILESDLEIPFLPLSSLNPFSSTSFPSSPFKAHFLPPVFSYINIFFPSFFFLFFCFWKKKKSRGGGKENRAVAVAAVRGGEERGARSGSSYEVNYYLIPKKKNRREWGGMGMGTWIGWWFFTCILNFNNNLIKI